MAQNSEYRTVAYFVNWAIYQRKHFPQDIPAQNLTHVLYAFANIRPETGEVYLTDSYADEEIHFKGDSWNDTGTNLYGCLKQLNLLKQKNRNMKVLLSIGGWTYSANFTGPASTEEGRKKFADSSLDLLLNYGFDGIDIDWEYPKSPTESQNFVQLLKICRETLDTYSSTLTNKHHFLITVATPAGPSNYSVLDISNMDRYLDFWNLMAYDYSGSWDKTSGHQANIYASPTNPTTTPFNTEQALKYYKDQGVSATKIVIGMPLYGRAFENTEGLGKPFSGVGKGDWEKGIYDYKNLPLSGSEEKYDKDAHASYSYDATKKELISYDTVQMAKEKAEWIKKESLGGGMWWETSGDGVGEKSLILTVSKLLGKLESSENCLEYPKSKFDNVKKISG